MKIREPDFSYVESGDNNWCIVRGFYSPPHILTDPLEIAFHKEMLKQRKAMEDKLLGRKGMNDEDS